MKSGETIILTSVFVWVILILLLMSIYIFRDKNDYTKLKKKRSRRMFRLNTPTLCAYHASKMKAGSMSLLDGGNCDICKKETG